MAMWIAMLFIIVGAILQASSFSVAQLIVARFITGIGTGTSTTRPGLPAAVCSILTTK